MRVKHPLVHALPSGNAQVEIHGRGHKVVINGVLNGVLDSKLNQIHELKIDLDQKL